METQLLRKSWLFGWGNSLPHPGEGFGGAAASRHGETGNWAGIWGTVVKRAARSGSLQGKFWGSSDTHPVAISFWAQGQGTEQAGKPHKNTAHKTTGFAKHSLPVLF